MLALCAMASGLVRARPLHRTALASSSACVALHIITHILAMATALNTKTYALRSGLLWNSIVPVYHWEGADAGQAFFFEQRYWLDYVRIANQTDYRKRERRGGYLKKRTDAWGLSADDVRLPSDDAASFKTVIFSTRVSLAWLFYKLRNFVNAGSDEQVRRCRSAIDAWCVMATAGFSRAQDQPAVLVEQAALRIDLSGHIDLSPLLERLPDMPQDWQALRAGGETCGMGAWPEDGRPLVADFLRFL